jgi:hypothetical protein
MSVREKTEGFNSIKAKKERKKEKRKNKFVHITPTNDETMSTTCNTTAIQLEDDENRFKVS